MSSSWQQEEAHSAGGKPNGQFGRVLDAPATSGTSWRRRELCCSSPADRARRASVVRANFIIFSAKLIMDAPCRGRAISTHKRWLQCTDVWPLKGDVSASPPAPGFGVHRGGFGPAPFASYCGHGAARWELTPRILPRAACVPGQLAKPNRPDQAAHAPTLEEALGRVHIAAACLIQRSFRRRRFKKLSEAREVRALSVHLVANRCTLVCCVPSFVGHFFHGPNRCRMHVF